MKVANLGLMVHSGLTGFFSCNWTKSLRTVVAFVQDMSCRFIAPTSSLASGICEKKIVVIMAQMRGVQAKPDGNYFRIRENLCHI